MRESRGDFLKRIQCLDPFQSIVRWMEDQGFIMLLSFWESHLMQFYLGMKGTDFALCVYMGVCVWVSGLVLWSTLQLEHAQVAIYLNIWILETRCRPA